jgi:hypothetical protein
MRYSALFRRSINKDTTAATAIEFAIVFPVFIYIIFFLIELSLICFSAITIENAVAEATRLAKVGATTGIPRDQYIRNEVRRRSYGLINPERLAITATTEANAPRPDYKSVLTDDFCVDEVTLIRTGFCPCPPGSRFFDNNEDGLCTPPGNSSPMDIGGPGDIVRYTVTYRWRVLTPILPLSTMLSRGGMAFGDASGDVLLVSGGAVRNE